jgi:hypothetical protein
MSDGGMIERFGCAVKNIAQLQELTAEGYLVQVHAQSATSEANLQACVACFLVGANEGAYFGAGNGWEGYDHDNDMTSWLKDWPEYSAPLGAPLGDAEVTTTTVGGSDDDASDGGTIITTYTRAFASGTTVFVNITVPPPSAANVAAASSTIVASLTASEDRVNDDAPGDGLGSQTTTTCIRWSNGATSGNGCDLPP